MDLLTLPFRLPLMPLQGLVRLAEILRDQAERELRDPASVRRQLEEAEQARVSGEMSDEDIAQLEGQAVGRLLSSPGNASPVAPARGKGTDPNGRAGGRRTSRGTRGRASQAGGRRASQAGGRRASRAGGRRGARGGA